MNSNKSNPVSFNNTELAFAHQSDAALNRSSWLFQMMGNTFVLKFGLKVMPLAVKWKIPFTKTIIRNTIFKQFVGGESLQETKAVVDDLARYQVQVILDYGAEGADSDDSLDHACAEFIKVIDYAAQQKNIPFISIKVTGIARFNLLEKLDAAMKKSASLNLVEQYHSAIALLDSNDQNAWGKSWKRFEKICSAAEKGNVAILVDAEETWIQDPVDAITTLMMQKYNSKKALVYNTIQLYRHDRFAFLRQSFERAKNDGYVLGVKLVRGAYMEKERMRAMEMQYESPIQPNKEASDADYNQSVQFVLNNIENIATIIASHNENSNMLACTLMQEKGIENNHSHIHFSQLYGMSDNITFNLAHHGYSVSKYLPFGPIHEVVPYLMRRAQENSSVAGQTGREMGLIQQERNRRKNK